MSAAERQRARLEALLERVRASQSRARRRVPAMSDEPDLVVCVLRCACGAHTTMALPGDEPARRTLAELVCPACGARGRLRLARSLAHAAHGVN